MPICGSLFCSDQQLGQRDNPNGVQDGRFGAVAVKTAGGGCFRHRLQLIRHQYTLEVVPRRPRRKSPSLPRCPPPEDPEDDLLKPCLLRIRLPWFPLLCDPVPVAFGR